MIRKSNLIGTLKRAVGGGMAVVKDRANGPMRAAESFLASSSRRGAPVTVRLIFCMRLSG